MRHSFVAEDPESHSSQEERKKRPRTAFTASQIKALETEFEKNKYLSVSKRMQLSKNLKLTETQVSDVIKILSSAGNMGCEVSRGPVTRPLERDPNYVVVMVIRIIAHNLPLLFG